MLGPQPLLITAAHVMHLFGRFDLCALPGLGGRLFVPDGKWLVSCVPEKPDPYDFGVIFLTFRDQEQLADSFRFLTHKDLNLSPEFPAGMIGVIAGYPLKRTEVRSAPKLYSQCLFARTSFVSPTRFPKSVHKPETHLFLDFKRTKGFTDDNTGRKTAVCALNGISGGGIFTETDGKLWLAAIITEFHEKRNVCGGTRISHIVNELLELYQKGQLS